MTEWSNKDRQAEPAVDGALRLGSTTMAIETAIRQNGRLVAKTTQTQAGLRPRH